MTQQIDYIARMARPLINHISRVTNGGERIATARDTLHWLRRGQRSLTAYIVYATQNRMGMTPQYAPEGQPVRQVQAHINFGRWGVQCPDCPGHEDADPAEPVFFCLSCGNDGYFCQVIFPENRAEIESILLARPIQNRNWEPGETLADLQADNDQHLSSNDTHADGISLAGENGVS